MRTFRIIAALAVAGLAASSASAQIANSAHNFSSYAWSNHEICRPCHIPHGGNSTAGTLWNHTMSTSTYTLFGGSSGTQADLDRVSQLCMSCHDGTVALDSFGGATNGTTFIDSAPYDGSAKLGSDLQNDHPIGKTAVYPTSTSTSFNPQTISNAGQSNEKHTVVSTAGTLSLYKMTVSGADAWVVGCKTCHDPHNKGNFGSMLRFSNTGSQLCLTCHIK
jgi:predicted CXXCH cytochrome family protein